ncbi:MAG: hypothetical protein AB1649_21360 [Chloroflexota bacterium]
MTYMDGHAFYKMPDRENPLIQVNKRKVRRVSKTGLQCVNVCYFS